MLESTKAAESAAATVGAVAALPDSTRGSPPGSVPRSAVPDVVVGLLGRFAA